MFYRVEQCSTGQKNVLQGENNVQQGGTMFYSHSVVTMFYHLG